MKPINYSLTLVIIGKNNADTYRNVERLLAPYDEKMEVKPYVCRSLADNINVINDDYRKFEHERARIDYPDDADSIIANIDSQFDLAINKAKNGDCKALAMLMNKWDVDSTTDDNGVSWSTYNPQSKWDHWLFVGKNSTKVRDLALMPFSVITPDGEWHEVTNENDFMNITADYAEHDCVLVNCHI